MDKIFKYDDKKYSKWGYEDGIEGSYEDLLNTLIEEGEISAYPNGYNYYVNDEWIGNDNTSTVEEIITAVKDIIDVEEVKEDE